MFFWRVRAQTEGRRHADLLIKLPPARRGSAIIILVPRQTDRQFVPDPPRHPTTFSRAAPPKHVRTRGHARYQYIKTTLTRRGPKIIYVLWGSHPVYKTAPRGATYTAVPGGVLIRRSA